MSKINSFKKSRKLAFGIAVAMGCSFAAVAFADGAIVAESGVTTSKSYSSAVNISAKDNMIAGGPWLPNIGSAVSASGEGTVLNLNLGSYALKVDGEGSSHSTGITAINKGVVNINSKGSMFVEANSDGEGQTAALFVNGGGKIIVNNDKNVLKLTGYTNKSTNGAVVKAMNGVKDTRSYINVKGLVDIDADTTDGEGMSEAVSAVASTIDIGGGKIFATKKGVNPGLNYGFAENCAIRAYGEFVSSNYGIVNVNVVKDGDALDAKATGAGKNDVQILGDFNTVGGMGTKGIINVGLNTKDSYWNGNYIKGAGWGETPGDYGSVNLFMGDGAKWVGNASFATNVKMTDENTVWKGYSLNNAVSAEITNDAAWYNYNEADTTALLHLTGSSNAKNAGLVYMTPFTKTVDGKSASYNTGNVSIANYAGNMKVFYKHDAADASKILGGDLTINSAEPTKVLSTGVGSEKYQVSEVPSTVYLQTSTDGIDTTDDAAINSVLDNLAKKLTYTAYVNGERNLSGRVELAEGLTSSSVSKFYSNITFDAASGQAKKENELFKPFTGIIFGNETSDAKNGYADQISGTAVGKDLKYTFNDDTLIDVKLNKDPRSFGWGGLYCAAINNYGDRPYQSSPAYTKGGPSYTIDMQGHDLNVNFSAFPAAGSTGSQPMWTAAAIGAYRDGTITIDNPGAVSITSTNNYYYGSAIRASTAAAGATGAHVIINNDNSKEHAVKIRGGIDTPGYQLNWRAIEVTTQNGTKAENGNSVDIKGLVDIDVKNCASLFARGNYATIDIGGGRIVSHNYSSIFTAGNEALINLNMQKDAEGNVIDAGNNYLQIEGDVSTATPYWGSNGTINVGLNTADSYLKGHFYGVGNNNLYLRNGAVWDNMPAVTHNWAGGSYSTNNIVSNISNLYGGADSAHAGNIYQHEAKDINIQNLSGYVNAYLAHENGEDGNANFDALGNIVVEKATKTDGKNACITLFTDRNGIDTSENNEVVNTLTALAKKLVYNEAINSPEVDTETETSAMDGSKPEINLDGKVGIAEGLTAGSLAIRLADLDFNKENGEGSLVAGSIHTPDVYVPVMYGSSETAMMKGAKSAMASTAMLWRAENNDLMKRMGDLRLSEGERGLWAKYYGGKYEMDSQNTDFNLKYNAYQLGYDADAGNGWTVGAAVSYNDGDATYGNGRGDLSAYSAGIYGTWKSEDGQYVDIIAKYSKLENDYKVFNDSGHKLSGDYKTWGTSISAEYGKRFENDNGFYFDPSVELTLGRINGKDYNAHSDYLDSVGVKKDMQVEQDAFNTLVGRVGFRLGQKLDNASYFVKLAAAHEFSGDFDTTFRAVNEPEGRTSIDFGDTWYEAQIGGTAKLSKNSLIYADFERSFGGDVEEKWRVDAGLRFTF